MKKFRDQGAIGALLDEYERAILELQKVIDGLNEKDLCLTVDLKTEDEDCRSIQTILTHVVRSGYCYIIEIRNSLGESIEFTKKEILFTTEAYADALDLMFEYTEKLFVDFPDIQLEETNREKKIKVKWGQTYDVEQLMEHAIVHILRHRRQIQRFLEIINSTRI